MSGRRSANGNRGFTLLEVMMAVLMIAILVMAVYRFVEANIRAISSSTEMSEDRQSVVGLVNFIQDQLNALPAENPNVLTGEPFKKNNLRGDRLEWICRAGEGVLTTAAPDEYRVTLTLESVDKSADQMAVGIRRRLVDEDIKNSKFMPLLRNVAAFKLRYFDKRQNNYVDQWRYPDAKPWLVEVSIWRNADEEPYVAVLGVPGANVQ
jgi:prepilin-type N-terminal cleavage/methylation domain-containing protein